MKCAGGWFVSLVMIALSGCLSSSNSEPSEETSNGLEKSGMVQHVSWLDQSAVYEVNIRQYTKEGTFRAFAEHLPRLKKMGIKLLWIMPVTPISKIDRKGTLGSYYAVSDYRSVNPEFGTMDDFKWLVKQAHDQGFKIITDWVANHTGADHPWLKTNRNFYMLDRVGQPKYAFDWSDTRELNYEVRELRDSMIANMKYWVDATDIDGFRCEVAGEVPDDFWEECIIELRRLKEVFMLAEGDNPSLITVGFDACYPWPMFQMMKKVASGERPATALDTVMATQDSKFPRGTLQLYFTSNHDENSWNKADYGIFPGAAHAPFAIFALTMKNALPLIYSGQEEPVLRNIEFYEKDTMGFRNYKRSMFYKTLLDLRTHCKALLEPDADFLRINAGDPHTVYSYIRENGKEKLLVMLNFSGKEEPVILTETSIIGSVTNVFNNEKNDLKPGTQFNLEPWGYRVFRYNN